LNYFLDNAESLKLDHDYVPGAADKAAQDDKSTLSSLRPRLAGRGLIRKARPKMTTSSSLGILSDLPSSAICISLPGAAAKY